MITLTNRVVLQKKSNRIIINRIQLNEEKKDIIPSAGFNRKYISVATRSKSEITSDFSRKILRQS